MRSGVALGALALLALCVASAVAVDSEVEAENEVAVQLPGFRESIAQQLRFFSQTTYCSVDSVTSWSCPVCKQGSLANFKLTHKFFDAYTNTFGFAGLAPAAGENVIIFSFRGATPSKGRNWITDLNARRIPYPGLHGASVHQGFYNAYLSIARQVTLAAKSLLANCQHCHVYVTGHSFGGAIATLAAADLYTLTPDLTVYTFGSPRVGDAAFATYYDKIVPDTFRIVHHQDLVPHIPQRFLGFRHVSQEVWYYGDAGNAYKQCNGGEDDSCSNSVNLHVDETSIKDHATYLEQPMGCRKHDLDRMGLISLIEESTHIASSTPFERLHQSVSGEEAADASMVEESAAVSASPKPKNAVEELDEADRLEALEDLRAHRLALSGGRDLTPARVLDPMSRPETNVLHAAFEKIEQRWNKLPLAWNPKVKSESEEARWNRKYPEPK